MKAQWNLQKKILQRMREFDMKPVLPAFQGFLPHAFRSLYNRANISLVGHCDDTTKLTYTFGCVAIVDAYDPLFSVIIRPNLFFGIV